MSIGVWAGEAVERGAVVEASVAGAADVRALLDQYCAACHNERIKAGSLVLTTADVTRIGEHAEMWEAVVRKVRGRLMPPAGRPRPDASTYEDFVLWLEAELDRFAAEHPNPGRTETFRRLNRTEYQNAIRDLLALDIDVAEFVPADDAAFGFDNIGGVFKLSSTLMERYLTAADKISRMAMGELPTVIDEGKVYSIPGSAQQHDRIAGLGLGTRGGTRVQHLFPQAAEYSFEILIDDQNFSGKSDTMELTIDGTPVEVFGVKSLGTLRESFFFKPDNVYEVRVPVSAGPHEVGVAFYGSAPALPEYLLRPFHVTKPAHVAGANAGPGGAAPVVKTVTIGGPFNPAGPGDTPSRRRVLKCRPATPSAETGCAGKILSTLARRAYRRPVTEADVSPLLDFYADSRAKGDEFEAAIQTALWRLLASPEFLFHIEAAPPGISAADPDGPAAYSISDIELASRVSFFLWSSIPDDRLLDLAGQGKLSDPAVLAQEVRRMVVDPRSEALTTSFAGQWLHLRQLQSARPGGDYAKNFDATLKEGLRRETELFFDSIVREDRPATELLTAEYTFLNERLAEHYGIHSVQGSHFRQVALPANSPRRGLLGQGSILTLTSQGIRTSPVQRGVYILEVIMGTPPPEPPPDVPALPNGKTGARPQTMRERMAAHRANPVCATCHSMIDPLGFGLENFDAVGAWRAFEAAGVPIDAAGTLPDGREFNDVNELRALLMQHPEQLVTTLTENLLTYALGRGLEPFDMPAVRKIVQDASVDDYRFQSILAGIVDSYPFRWRSATTPALSAVSASR